MQRLAEVPWWFRSVIRRLGQRSTIAVVIALLAVSVLAGAALVSLMEMLEGTNGPRHYLDSLWWFVVTITGVGLDAVAPVSQFGRAISATVLLMARIFFGMFTAAIASALINRLLMEGRGMGDVTLRGHAVICGWNSKGNQIIAQLTHDERKQDIVILAELESTPVRHAHVTFVHGDPTRELDLHRAGVDKAETVIILADETYPGHTDSTIDARSVLVALAVEHTNPGAYTFAEVCQPENRDHFRHAHVNEMLVSNEIVSDLIARASVLHGLSKVISDLLAIGTGSDIYIVPPPPSMVGVSFDDAMVTLQGNHQVILIGVQRNDNVVLNPQEALTVDEHDALIVIARSTSTLFEERRSVFAQ